MEQLREVLKKKEEENKKGKTRTAKSARPSSTRVPKAKTERVSTPKNKTKLQIKDKPAPHKIDKLNQTAKHSGGKKFKFGKEAKENKEEKEKEKKEKEEKIKKEKEEKQKLAERKKKEKEEKMKEEKKKERKKLKREKKKKKKKKKN